jgi:tripartite-type tricarboxylate transporter receptor subunit TctC
MKINRARRKVDGMHRWMGVLCMVLSTIQPASAQDFPVPGRPVRIIVGFPPGGGADLAARLLAPKLSESWAHPVIVDNRPGAGGNLAAEFVARAAPDGHTIIVMPGPAALSLFPEVPFDLKNDFAPITLAGRSPNVVVVHPSVPASTVKELIALARSQPGKLNYASSGIGLTPHLSGELLRRMTSTDIVHVPYKGAGPAVTDLVGGRVHLMSVSITAVLGFIRDQRLRAIGVTSLERWFLLPDVPTLHEAGVPGYELYGWWGILAPAKTPREVVMKLNAAAVEGLNSADIRKRFAAEGVEVVANTPAQFSDFLYEEVAKWDALFAGSAKPSR